MSEESGESKPPKLKLSSSKNQPEKQSTAATTSPSVNASAPDLSPPTAAPAPIGKHSSTPRTTPPPLSQQSTQRVSQVAAKPVEQPVKKAPPPPTQKNDSVGTILIIAALLFILAAAAGGIWFVLGSNDSATPEEVIPLEVSPSNPIERAKATIATVPDRNIDPVLDLEPTSTIDSEAVPTADTNLAKKSSKEAISQYLQNIHIDGIRSGARARIMLNGENYNINDTVDPATGLIFIGTRNKQLLFKDSNGTIYVKSF